MKGELVRLPDHVVAPLLRALEHVRHAPHCRLYLQAPDSDRAPVWNTPRADYDVIWRGAKVGRIWRFIYRGERHEGWPWHWVIRAEHRPGEEGHALTLHEAMEQFRAAWDRLKPDAVVGEAS
jgi:hypothetical protein